MGDERVVGFDNFVKDGIGSLAGSKNEEGCLHFEAFLGLLWHASQDLSRVSPLCIPRRFLKSQPLLPEPYHLAPVSTSPFEEEAAQGRAIGGRKRDENGEEMG